MALASAAERLRGHALERFSDPRLAADDRRPRRADVALQLERLAGVLEQGSLVVSPGANIARAGASRVDGDLTGADEGKMRAGLHGRPIRPLAMVPGMTYDMTPAIRSRRAARHPPAA